VNAKLQLEVKVTSSGGEVMASLGFEMIGQAMRT